MVMVVLPYGHSFVVVVVVVVVVVGAVVIVSWHISQSRHLGFLHSFSTDFVLVKQKGSQAVFPSVVVSHWGQPAQLSFLQSFSQDFVLSAHQDLQPAGPLSVVEAMIVVVVSHSGAMSATEVKLFGKWSYEEVNVSDLSLVDYIAVGKSSQTFLSHTQGRYQAKRFRKALCPIVERLCCS